MHCHTNKLYNVDKMGKFLEKHNPQRLKQEDIVYMNKQVMTTGIETVIKKFPTDKNPGPDGFTEDSIKYLW